MRRHFFGLFVLVACFASANIASASLGSLQIWLSDDGGATFTNVAHAAQGTSADFTGTFGDFDVTFVATSSNSPGGPPSSVLNLNSLQVYNTGASTAALTVLFGDAGFTFPTSLSMIELQSGIGGFETFGDSNLVSFETFIDFGNGPNATDTYANKDLSSGVLQPTLNGEGTAFGTNNSVVSSQFGAVPYSMGATVTVELDAYEKVRYNGSATAFNVVPEPATIAVWSLLGVAAVCVYRRRRK